MMDLTPRQQTELQKRVAGIRAELPHAQRGTLAIQEIARLLFEIRALQLCAGSLDTFCQAEFHFSGSWGSRLADWYAVRRNIASSQPDGERSLGTMEFLADLTESCAREIKHLTPAQQVQAWEEASQGDEKPTARVLARIAAQFNVSPEEIEAMSADEQRRVFLDIDAAIAEAKRIELAATTAKLAIKRNRKVLDDMRKEPLFAPTVPLLEKAMADCESLRLRLEEPLFRMPTAEEKLAEALREANEAMREEEAAA